MSAQVSIIGFGEAAKAFVSSSAWVADARAYDKLTDQSASRPAKLADYAAAGVAPALTLEDAVEGAGLILSLVTADQALAVASSTANLLPGSLYCDMNSVAPVTKQAAAAAVARQGAQYVDVAIMAPVHPARLGVPLLLSGPAASAAEERLRSVGFSNCRVVGSRVGAASTIKMLRSVIIKGLEALTAEAMLGAAAAGVVDEVLASLEMSERAQSWSSRADYNLDRMMEHGVRRADEMEEAVRTLEALGVEPALTRGTVSRQRAIGSLGLRPASGLEAKLSQLVPAKADAA